MKFAQRKQRRPLKVILTIKAATSVFFLYMNMKSAVITTQSNPEAHYLTGEKISTETNFRLCIGFGILLFAFGVFAAVRIAIKSRVAVSY